MTKETLERAKKIEQLTEWVVKLEDTLTSLKSYQKHLVITDYNHGSITLSQVLSEYELQLVTNIIAGALSNKKGDLQREFEDLK